LAAAIKGNLTSADSRSENEFLLIKRWWKEFDFLYLVGRPSRNRFPDLLTEITAGEHFVLYRIRKDVEPQ